jgi:hypothetical protein
MKAEDIHAVLAADGWRVDGENETHPTTASSLNKTLAMRKPSTQDIRFTNNGSLFVLDKSKKIGDYILNKAGPNPHNRRIKRGKGQ